MTFAGEWPLEDALDHSLARSEWLFDGTAFERGHRFLRAAEGGRPVGWIWEGPSHSDVEGPGHWLYQITVEEALRGRGVGNRVLAALERLLSREGVPELRLNVFRWNEAALRLYERRGYAVVGEFPTTMHLRKLLSAR
jgi:ribosomal protein S18 acetylase RimI-like enzyme